MKKEAYNINKQEWMIFALAYLSLGFSLIAIALFFLLMTGIGYEFFFNLQVVSVMLPVFYGSSAISAVFSTLSLVFIRKVNSTNKKKFIRYIFSLSAISFFLMLVIVFITISIGSALNSR